MKKLLIVLVSFCCIVCLLSCSQTNLQETGNITTTNTPSNGTTTPQDDELSDEYFDSELVDKPSHADILSISSGMSIHEIIDVIGRPHRMGGFSGIPSLEWETVDGNICTIAFAISENAPESGSTVDLLMQYGVSVNVIYTDSEGKNIVENNPNEVKLMSHIMSSDDDDVLGKYFDEARINKPALKKTELVTQGMSVKEIIDIIGRPHSFGYFSGPPSLLWETQEGQTCCVVFALTENVPKDLDSIEQLMDYGVAMIVRISK